MATVIEDNVGIVAQMVENLSATFPDLADVMPLRVLGEGFRSIAVKTGGDIVFRIGRNATAIDGYRKELRLLPYLAQRLSVAVPEPQWYAEPCAHFPFGVIGYPALRGVSVAPHTLPDENTGQIAAAVAAFLVTLHHVPPQEAAARGVPHEDTAIGRWVSLRDDVLPVLQHTLSTDEYRVIHAWWDVFLAEAETHRYAPALCHGDLWYEHLLVDEERRALVGVLDFEQAVISDTAQDFAPHFYLGRAFVARLLEAYAVSGGTVDAHFRHRVWRWWEVREFGGVQFALHTNDDAELADSIGKLRRGPLLRGQGDWP